MNESGVNDIIVGSTTIIVGSMGDCVSVLLKGSENAIQNAIGMIKDTIGTANVSCEMIDQPSQVEETSAAVRPNLEDNIPEDSNVQPTPDDASADEHDVRRRRSLARRDRMKKIREREELQQQLRKEEEIRLAELAKREDAVQQTKDHQRVEAEQLKRNRAKATEKKNAKKEDTVVKVDAVANTEQAKDQEEASEMNVFKKEEEDFYFTIDEPDDDPLLIFLRSQESCIKGSVDEFYNWLIKSEDIDSMAALKEAVSDDVYLNEKMKKLDGSSGVKGFKLKPFQRAVLEYDTKSTAKVHQSLPQCQMKNQLETLEPPDELVCPISLVLMTNDPVVAADGITYERASIKDWFKKSKAKGNIIYSPVHGTKLKNLALTPNISVRNMARAFKDKK